MVDFDDAVDAALTGNRLRHDSSDRIVPVCPPDDRHGAHVEHPVPPGAAVVVLVALLLATTAAAWCGGRPGRRARGARCGGVLRHRGRSPPRDAAVLLLLRLVCCSTRRPLALFVRRVGFGARGDGGVGRAGAEVPDEDAAVLAAAEQVGVRRRHVTLSRWPFRMALGDWSLPPQHRMSASLPPLTICCDGAWNDTQNLVHLLRRLTAVVVAATAAA